MRYDASHDGARHAGPSLRGPSVLTLFESGLGDIEVSHIVTRIRLGIVTVEGRDNVCARSKDIGLGETCQRRSSAAIGRHLAIAAPVVAHISAFQVVEACSVGSGTNANDIGVRGRIEDIVRLLGILIVGIRRLAHEPTYLLKRLHLPLCTADAHSHLHRTEHTAAYLLDHNIRDDLG